MNEQGLQKKIQDYLKSQDFYVFKTIQTNRAGVPDVIACASPTGTFVGIEVKIGYNKPRKLQQYHIEAIKKAGGVAGVCWSLQEVKDLLEENELV